MDAADDETIEELELHATTQVSLEDLSNLRAAPTRLLQTAATRPWARIDRSSTACGRRAVLEKPWRCTAPRPRDRETQEHKRPPRALSASVARGSAAIVRRSIKHVGSQAVARALRAVVDDEGAVVAPSGAEMGATIQAARRFAPPPRDGRWSVKSVAGRGPDTATETQ